MPLVGSPHCLACVEDLAWPDAFRDKNCTSARHPAVLANMAATIDITSGGRLEIGLGAGWNDEESGAYGIGLGDPKERSDRFEGACQVIVSLFRNETTTFEGSYFKLSSARCEPKPVQRPHPPICIGGSDEKRTLRTAARYARHWNFAGGSPEDLRRKLEVLEAHCAEVGRDRSEILVSSHVEFDGDPGRTAEIAASLFEAGAELGIVQLRPPHDPSVLEPLARRLSEVR